MLIAAVTATYFARYAIKTNILSEMLNDRTQGQDFVPEVAAQHSVRNVCQQARPNGRELWAKTGSDWVYDAGLAATAADVDWHGASGNCASGII